MAQCKPPLRDLAFGGTVAGVKLREVTKAFGSVEVVKRVSLDVADGEFLKLVGPSGRGKSTLLRIIHCDTQSV